ncbi:hypothetical protein [Rheinheimera maricola]|uniref:Uncharacterized protein n=1 Tax=Rheinheimera maricola TaxID=2793282 RepID=A0ABS7X676_9GAMM|nr:hypothetical protein [Rheinheimera maricola]MBZ9610821.1 hypothetical protein [Rheinheimera maricola]
MKHIVEISKQALTQMLLNGFEAFVIKHGDKKRSGIEFHASLYGDIKILDKGKKYRHVIEFISVDTSAEMNSGSVSFSIEASDLKEDIAEQMGFYQLGKMHSHPYLAHEMSVDEVRKQGFDFSPGDLEAISDAIDRYEEGLGYHLEVLLTITEMKQKNTSLDGRKESNLFEFSVGNCKCFLHAQVFSKSDDKLHWDDTELRCSFLEQNGHLEANFGLIKAKKGRKRVLEYKPNN